MKRFIIASLLLILVLAICGGLIWFNFFRDKMITQFFATMQMPASTVSAIDVKPATWNPGIDAVGTVAASQGVDVAVEAGGIVKQIQFKANDKVAADQLLVQIDDAVERAGLLSAQSTVAVNQDALDRAKTLLNRNVNTVADLQSAQNKLDLAEGELAKLHATLDQKAVKAPFAGTIGIPKIDVGQYLQVGTVVATLQNLDLMKVNFTVPEQQLGALSIGQTAKFGLTEDKLDYTGKISGIDPKIDPMSRLVSVQALVDNSKGELRPGQFIRVRADLPAEPNIIALPQTAVTISLYGSYVYVVTEAPKREAPAGAPPAAGASPAPPGPNLVARQLFVTTGRRNGDQIEIIKGVDAGMKIVTAGQNKLSNGSAVAIDNEVDVSKGAAAAGAAKP